VKKAKLLAALLIVVAFGIYIYAAYRYTAFEIQFEQDMATMCEYPCAKTNTCSMIKWASVAAMNEYCQGVLRPFFTVFMEGLEFAPFTYEGLGAFGLVGVAIVTLYWDRARQKEERERPTLEKWT
jgi:hypothetical protein